MDSAQSQADRFGIAASTLKKRCPEEYEALKLAGVAWRAQVRRRKLAERKARIRAAFEWCLKDGLPPTRDRVLARAGFNKIRGMDENIREVFRKLRQSSRLNLG